jgi:hypothetical protein
MSESAGSTIERQLDDTRSLLCRTLNSVKGHREFLDVSPLGLGVQNLVVFVSAEGNQTGEYTGYINIPQLGIDRDGSALPVDPTLESLSGKVLRLPYDSKGDIVDITLVIRGEQHKLTASQLELLLTITSHFELAVASLSESDMKPFEDDYYFKPERPINYDLHVNVEVLVRDAAARISSCIENTKTGNKWYQRKK